MTKRILHLLLVSLFVSFNSFVIAQEAVKPRPSPLAIITMKYEDKYVKITYCQPHKKGRDIFGDLVPFGKVWRTGANEATEITLTGAVIFGKDTLQAGTYSLFTIPETKLWTVIVNKGLGQWGAYNYLDKADVIRTTVPVQTIEDVVYEPFTMAFEQKNEKAELVMMWDKTKIVVPIQFIE